MQVAVNPNFDQKGKVTHYTARIAFGQAIAWVDGDTPQEAAEALIAFCQDIASRIEKKTMTWT